MSINVKPKISFPVREDTSLAKNLLKNFSINRISVKAKNLTDNKEINFNYRRADKSNKNLTKAKDIILAQREAEYDKNLKRIKSNLLDKFNNYSLLNSSHLKENDEKSRDLNKTQRKKLTKERSRYKVKQYSPSVLNSKKFAHLEIENVQLIQNEDSLIKIEEKSKQMQQHKEISKNSIISMRIGEKENYDDEIVFDYENFDSKNKMKKKRFAKRISNDENNVFSIENDCGLANPKKNSLIFNDKFSGVKQGFEKNSGLLFNSNAANNDGTTRENKFSHFSSNDKILISNNFKGFLTQSNTTKNTYKKFIFNTRVDKSGEDMNSKFSEFRKRIENNSNLTNNKTDEENLSINKKLIFVNNNNNNNYINNESNFKLNNKNENSFEDVAMQNENEKSDNKDEFVNKLQNNYKEFIKENFDTEDIKILEAKDAYIPMENEEDDFIIEKPFQNKSQAQEPNICLSKRFSHLRKNSGLEIIQENAENDYLRNSGNKNPNLSFSEMNNFKNNLLNTNNTLNNNNDRSCILESGGLSKKFSEMKKTISNNLNNIHNLNTNANEYSEYKVHNMLLNNESSNLFASSLINSMESIKNIKQNIRIFSNNLNANNDLITNNDFSTKKTNNINQNNEMNNNNNYIRSLQNSNINNVNPRLNLSNRFNANQAQFQNIENPKTPEIIHANNNMLQNQNFLANYNPYVTQYNYPANINNFHNNASFIPCSTIYNSNNFDLRFNNLNLNSNPHHHNYFNNQLNSIYQNTNLNQNQINEQNFTSLNNNFNTLSGQFKNYNNTNNNNNLNKINLNNFSNNHNNNLNNNPNLNYASTTENHLSYTNNNTINITNSTQKINQAPQKNKSLQEQINLINLSFTSNQKIAAGFQSNSAFESSSNKANSIFANIKLLDDNASSESNSIKGYSVAEKFIFFSTEQYRNLLNVFLNIDYGKDILKDFYTQNIEMPKPILINHAITDRMRSKMVDWIIEVTENYRCDQTTYFLAVSLMDSYFCCCAEILKPEDLHIIGVCCMFIASKYYDIFPIKLASASEKISHGKISKEQIKAYEEKILKTLCYDISKPTAYDFLNFYTEDIFNVFENNYNIKNEVLRDYIRQYIDFDNKRENKFDKNYYERFTKTKDFDSKFLQTLKRVLLYLSKMNCYDIGLSTIKPSLLAGATLILGVKITEQILQNNYINDYLLGKIAELSVSNLNEIYFIAEKILNNCKNFENIFPNLENLKKFYFEFLK